MGFDFTQMIGGGGATGEILTGLDLAVEATLCVGLLDIFACFKALVDVFTLVWELFLGSLFEGRPKVGKDSASDDTALFFISAGNPVVQLWGMGIRGLEGQGIPTSVSGGAGLTKTIQLAEAVLADLKLQFDGPSAPRLMYHNPFGTFPVTGLNLFSWYHQLGFQTNHPDSNAEVIAVRAQIDTFYQILVRDHYIDPKTGFPFQPGGGPPPPPPPPPQPGHIPPPPKAPPHNADEQEICCWYEEQYQYYQAASLDQIYNLLKNQAANDQCCNRVITALTSIHTGLGQIVAGIAAGAKELAHPIDLTPIEKGLGALVAELHADNAAAHTVAGELLKAVERIASAEEKEKAIDLKPIIDALNEANKLQDIPKNVIDQLVAEDLLTPQMAQAVGGSAVAKVRLGVDPSSPATWATRLDRWFHGEAPPHYPTPKGHSDTVSGEVKDIFTAVFKASSTVFSPIVKGILDAHNGEIAKLRNVGPCEEAGGANELLTEAIGAGIAAHFASVAAEAIFITKNLGLEKIADIIVALAGVEPIIEALIGTEIRQLIKIPHEYCINAQGRTILPGMGPAGGLHARGLITEAQARQLLAWNGLHREYENPTLTAAYSGLNPRQLLRLSATGLFTEHDLADEMTFAGLRAASQHRMLIAAPYLATDPERKQLRAAYEKAYVEGFSTDAELTQQLDDAEHNTSRTFLILDRVRLEKRMALAKELEAEYTTLYLGNQINLDTYHADLVGLGLQDDRVRALTARNEARAAVTLARQEASAARALARATAAAERKAALRNYLQGNIPAAALALALEATGLTPAQTAAWVDMATLQIAGAPRYKFGLRIAPAEAELLTDRVRALDDQRKRQLITDAVFINALKALKIPQTYINALRAAAEATITPAKSATAIPVETGA